MHFKDAMATLNAEWDRLDEIMAKLELEVEPLFAGENSGHDIYHLRRVRNLALSIQIVEGGSPLVIGIAAFLHDLHRAMQKDHGRYCTPVESLDLVRDIINRAGGVTEPEMSHILHCIEHHEEYSFGVGGKTVHDLETQIVQDADNLDAFGAIGIARAFMYAGARKVPMYLPDIPIEFGEYTDAVDGRSEIHHFHSKMLRLSGTMNTETAKNMAIRRHEFVEKFLRQFHQEWDVLNQ